MDYGGKIAEPTKLIIGSLRVIEFEILLKLLFQFMRHFMRCVKCACEKAQVNPYFSTNVS